MRRIILKDVAKRAGLSVSCTARALKGLGGIPPSTCLRVRAVADRLGYRPDPMLTALSAYRQARKPASYQGTMAFLSTFYDEKAWLANPENGDLLRGARSRAESLGYRIDYFNVGRSRNSQLRLWKILQARGIRGALVRSFPVPVSDLHLPFDKFACVDLFSAPYLRELPTVSSYHAQSMELALNELLSRNYRRPALVLGKGLSQYLHHGWQMAFRVYAPRFSQALMYPHEDLVIDFSDLQQWAGRRKVDSLIFCLSENFLPQSFLKKCRSRSGFGVVSMDLLDQNCGLSGIYQNRPRGGAVAVEWLQSMLINSQAGSVHNPDALMIPGVWIEGTSLPTRRK